MVLEDYRVARQTRKAHKSNDGTKIKSIPNKKSCETSATISATISSERVAVKARDYSCLVRWRQQFDRCRQWRYRSNWAGVIDGARILRRADCGTVAVGADDWLAWRATPVDSDF